MTIPLMLNIALIRAHAFQRPFRTLLSIAGVALGVLASVAIGTANVQVLQSFEQAVTTVLTGTVHYSIDADLLKIDAGGPGLVFRASS